MNVILPEKSRNTKRRVMIYVAILSVCVIATGIAIYQFFADEKLEVILGLVKEDDEKIEQLKSEFESLFTSKQLSAQNYEKISKVNQDKELVDTQYELDEKSQNNYDINVHIPYINIDNNITKTYNEEIKRNFEVPIQTILQTENRSISYSVNYMARIENNILSVALLSTFKDGNKAQRTMIKTYNYDIINNKKISLEDFLEIKEIDKNAAEAKIKRTIEKSEEQTEKLRELGYNIYARDSTDSMYKIDNTTEFFMNNGYLYLIYPYGNNDSTSEMDLIII